MDVIVNKVSLAYISWLLAAYVLGVDKPTTSTISENVSPQESAPSATTEIKVNQDNIIENKRTADDGSTSNGMENTFFFKPLRKFFDFFSKNETEGGESSKNIDVSNENKFLAIPKSVSERMEDIRKNFEIFGDAIHKFGNQLLESVSLSSLGSSGGDPPIKMKDPYRSNDDDGEDDDDDDDDDDDEDDDDDDEDDDEDYHDDDDDNEDGDCCNDDIKSVTTETDNQNRTKTRPVSPSSEIEPLTLSSEKDKVLVPLTDKSKANSTEKDRIIEKCYLFSD